MSRHFIPALNPAHRATVGWDRPMGTFFGQVHDLGAPEDKDDLLAWVGNDFRAIQTTEELARLMSPHAILQPDAIALLQADKDRDGDGSARGKAQVTGVLLALRGMRGEG